MFDGRCTRLIHTQAPDAQVAQLPTLALTPEAKPLKASGIKGGLAATWAASYADLEAFAQAAWGQK